MNRLLRLIAFVAVLVLLSACSDGPKAALTPTLAPSATETPRPSETPVPTDTASPTASATPTPTPSATATPLPSETPRPSFAGFSVEYAQLTSYGMILGFKVPGIKENYRLMVNKVEYKCELNAKLPDRIVCSGQQFRQGETVKFTFLPLTEETPAYETSYKVALLKTATPDPRTMMAQGGVCPVSSTNKVRCETEYRKDGKGGFCIVTTCFDSNGKCGSIDTCPAGSENNGIFIMTGTPPLP